MKERFVKQTLEVVTFDAEDVIVTSGCSLVDCDDVCYGVICNAYCPKYVMAG